MTVLISGATGNLGTFLARHLLRTRHDLRLLVHRRPLLPDIAAAPNVSVYQADLDDPRTLTGPCRGVDCVVHVAGLLRRRMLAVWTRPTWYHMLSLPDFLSCVQAAIERDEVSGI